MKRCIAGALCAFLLLPLFVMGGVASAAGTVENSASRDGGYLVYFDESETWTATDADVALTDSERGTALAIYGDFGKESCSPEIIGSFEPVDVSDMTHVTFQMYLPDPVVLDGTRQIVINLMSEGEKNGRLTWMLDPTDQPYADGWNQVTLYFSEAVNTSFDFQSASSLRFFFYDVTTDRELSGDPILLANMRLASLGTRNVLLDNCDSEQEWQGWNIPTVLDTADRKEGKASISWTVALEERDYLVSQRILSTPVNGEGAVNLVLDLYISDVQAINRSRYGLEIEITSSGKCDHQEYEFDWGIYGKNLKNGWNHLILPISTARVSSNGAPDMKAINFIRLHMLGLTEASGGALTVKMDNVYLSVLNSASSQFWIEGEHERTPENPDAPENPDTPENPDSPDINSGDTPQDTGAAREKTLQRAKILMLVFVFTIIGVDVVVVSVRRRFP